MSKIIAVLCALLLLIVLLTGNEKAPTPAEDTLYLSYNGALYTDLYVRDIFLTSFWEPDGVLDGEDIAYFVYADAPDEKDMPKKIQTYSGDPDNNFIMEKEGLLFPERLYRKVSFEIPDYTLETTRVETISFSQVDANYNSKTVSTLTEPEDVKAFMQTVRDAVWGEDIKTAPDNIPMDDRLACDITFEGIGGSLYIGTVYQDAKQQWTFSAMETNYSTALPESLQGKIVL